MRSNRHASFDQDVRVKIRDLVQRLNPVFAHRSCRVITFISARPGEGTTTIAEGFTEALAHETKRKVMLLGIDRTHRRFVMQITDHSIAVGKSIAANQLSPVTMQSLGFGTSLTETIGSHDLASPLMHSADFWESMKDSFDTIVIDAPSLQSSSDGMTLASKSDAVIIVVEADSTRQPVVENLRDMLRACGAPIAGVVMNKRRYYIPERVYKSL